MSFRVEMSANKTKFGRRYSIIKVIMEREKKTNLAIEELGIVLNQEDDNDKYELTDLLCQILAYPTLEEAQLHRKANRLGNFDLLTEQSRLLQLLNSKNTNQIALCPCCGNIVNQSEISFLCQLQQIRLGVGVRLYFTTLLYYLVIFFIAFCLYSLYAMITNINAKQQIEDIANLCSESSDCSTANLGLGSKLVSYNQFKSQIAVQAVLGFMYVLVYGFLIVKKYYSDRVLESELKADWLSASEFTLMLSNYPLNLINPKSNEQTLSNVSKLFKDYENQIKSRIAFDVVKISIGYPLFKWDEKNEEHIIKGEEEISQKRKIFIDLIKQRQRSKYFQMQEEKRNEHYEQFYQILTNHEYQKNNMIPDLEQKNVMFVTLRYSRAREQIEKINKNRNSWWSRCFQEANSKLLFPLEEVKIKKAPEPDEIKWENIGFPKSLRLCRKILIYSVAMLLIGITLLISYLLGSLQSNKPVLISILISIFITIFNFLIELLIIVLSSFEREVLKSKEEASIGIKIAVSQIINCIGVPVLLACLGQEAIYEEGGLVTNVFFISLFNMLLPIGRFIDPFNIILKLREKYFEDAQKRLTNLKGQFELNKIFTFYQFELGYEYAYIIKTSYFTAFFLPLMPVIGIFAPIGLALMFFCNKYRLLYRFNKPNFHSSSVNAMLTFILKCSLIAFSMGQLYFMNFQNYSANFNLIINWVSLALSALFVFFPLKYCRRFFVEFNPPCMDYNEQLLYLTTDYDRLNPVTKEKAINQFRQFLEQYEKKCHLPLPQKSEIIRRSLFQMSKMQSGMSRLGSASIVNFMREKTKFHHNLGSGLHTNDRLR